jgi:hypothetical protein
MSSPTVNNDILRVTHISRCAKASGRSEVCTCLPTVRNGLIQHALAGLTMNSETREVLLNEISKISNEVRDSK